VPLPFVIGVEAIRHGTGNVDDLAEDHVGAATCPSRYVASIALCERLR
jgi:hypothetical protein